MNNNGFKMCADCTNKRFIDIDAQGRNRYYCPSIDGIIRNGIVYDTTNATACIKWGLFKDSSI
jgi:hypothetical protein